MPTQITMVSMTKMLASARGNKMTLEYSYADSSWMVITQNASNRAYNRGMPMPRYFNTLIDVEKAYKSFKGVVSLCEGLDIPAITCPQDSNQSYLQKALLSC